MSFKKLLVNQVENAWYGGSQWSRVLAPLLPLYKHSAIKAKVRGQLAARACSLNIPIIVVGNITAGGTGKSPVVTKLAQELVKSGYQPGILSRGYAAKLEDTSYLVSSDDSADYVGDEPLMMALSLPNIPVVVDRDRLRGAQYLQQTSSVDVIICDDGLQHYRLPRDIEIAVLDSERGVGNGYLIPVGPLREPVERLDSVDYVLSNGSTSNLPKELIASIDYEFDICPKAWWRIKTSERIALEGTAIHANEVNTKEVLAISGIGNPKRFHKSLQALGLKPIVVNFPDHHKFTSSDFVNAKKQAKSVDTPIVMTAKDAVKCISFAEPDWFALEIEAALPEQLLKDILVKLHQIKSKKEN